MGGGDLNTKKSWHPNTMKNQERVWKAEQAAVEEKKRILQLQYEREEERDRAQLNEMVQKNFGAAPSGSDNRLHWMYDKPDKQEQAEDYLLGKAIGKSDETENAQNSIPAINRRVVGSSMLTTGDDSQVDLARKLREDPLLLVKERERAARAALLNNPLQRKRLAELLRKEQVQKENKIKKKSKKKGKDLDSMLAAKLNSLGAEKGMDLASLLNSDDSDSSTDSSSDDERSKSKIKKKKKHKSKKTKKNKKKAHSDSDTEEHHDERRKKNKKYKEASKSKERKESRKQHNDSSDSDYERQKERSESKKFRYDNETKSRRKNIDDARGERIDSKRSKKHESRYHDDSDDERKNRNKEDSDRKNREYKRRRDITTDGKDCRSTSSINRSDGSKKRKGLSEEERAAKLAEMAAAGVNHERERERRVAQQRADDDAAEHTASTSTRRNKVHSLPESLQDRIHSNRHYLQRDQAHMDKHFARR